MGGGLLAYSRESEAGPRIFEERPPPRLPAPASAPQLATSDVGVMTRARLQVGRPWMPPVSSTHMQQMD